MEDESDEEKETGGEARGGRRLPFTPFAVDCWNTSSAVAYFFLTHAHSDHLEGLTPSFSQGPIFCSLITKKILLQKIPLQNPHLIVTLPIGETKRLYINSQQEIAFEVTLFEANHCAGAVMFLFEGYFGRILYTGDFRYDPHIMNPIFIECEKGIDYLYLDTTYCDPAFDFPSQEEATKAIKNIISSGYPGHHILLGTDSLGKEELFLELATYFNTQILVSSARFNIIEAIDYYTRYFTTNPDHAFIEVVPKAILTEQRIISLNKYQSTIGIIASALKIHQSISKNVPLYQVMYSLHSSFSELLEFVSQVKPRKIIPLTNANVSYFDSFLDPSPSLPIKVPEQIYLNQPQSISNSNDLLLKDNKKEMNVSDQLKLFYPNLEDSPNSKPNSENISRELQRFSTKLDEFLNSEKVLKSSSSKNKKRKIHSLDELSETILRPELQFYKISKTNYGDSLIMKLINDYYSSS